jgi:hypothetical protein
MALPSEPELRWLRVYDGRLESGECDVAGEVKVLLPLETGRSCLDGVFSNPKKCQLSYDYMQSAQGYTMLRCWGLTEWKGAVSGSQT